LQCNTISLNILADRAIGLPESLGKPIASMTPARSREFDERARDPAAVDERNVKKSPPGSVPG